MRRLLPPLAALGLLVIGPAPLRTAAGQGASLTGTLRLTEKGNAVSEALDAVVWFEPAGGAARPAPVRATVETRDRRFSPRVTVVPVGSDVWFPNGDPILHNVFSVSPGNRFDLGLYRTGPGKPARLTKPGLVRVYCNVHHAMVAYVLALATPYVARPAADGRFALEGLPLGRGTLHVWHERAGASSREIEVPSEVPLELSVELQSAGAVPHLDKHGRPYRERGGDDYR